jgi:putative protease
MPSGNQEITLNALQNHTGEAIDVAPGSGHRVYVPYSGEIPERALLAKFL